MNIMNVLRDLGVVSVLGVGVLLVVCVLLYMLYDNFIKDTRWKNVFWASLFIVFLAIIMSLQFAVTASFDGKQFDRGEWQPYFKERLALEYFDPAPDLANTLYYDYENPIISDVADKIAEESRSAAQAVNSVLRYVYENVEYDSFESDAACFDGTAPSILEKGTGQCDTQTIVVISMLRRMGIPARPVGGCVVFNHNKCIFQAMFMQSFQDAGLAPKIGGEVVIDDEVFGRGQSPQTGSRQGGLHAWVVAWLPDEGWVHLEPTTGRRVNHNCYFYHVELFPENHQKTDICVSKNPSYAQACRNNDFKILDAQGMGLALEVEVR